MVHTDHLFQRYKSYITVKVILSYLPGAVALSCLSYGGKVRIGAVIDRAVAPDDDVADRLLGNIVEEIKHLHKSVV